MRSRQDKIKSLLIIWAIFLIFLGCTIFVLVKAIMSEINKVDSAVHVNLAAELDETIPFDADYSIKGMIEDNYVKYLHMAYIVLGEYPDCRLVKISANVARNDYNWKEEFYCPDGELYWRRYKDGNPEGRIAIDVSEYQNNIDWPAVKASGVDVAIIRAGYRGWGESARLVPDANFDQNMQGAADAGIETGVYFFSEAVNRDEGVEEAEYVLSMVQGYNVTQPIVIDTEYIYDTEGVRANDISAEDRTAAVVGFCETIKAAGYTPMIYASRDQFIFNLDIDAIGDYEFWLACYDTPNFPYHSEGYQYSPYGLVSGIEGNVDLDVWMR